ncbi:proton-conducting transporter membrane subunit [Anaplasma phagocytophilum]|uniref:proton-conducting transporter transmembrane domain-containing protein n=1 Tax=Anaplasma phagocytophilum TaxID=948 RepID=UPI00201AE578
MIIDLLCRPDVLLFVVVSLPFVCSALIIALKRFSHSQEVLSTLASLALFLTACALYLGLHCKPAILQLRLSSAILFILEPEALGIVFGILVSFLWAVTNIYTIGYMNKVYGKLQDRSVFYSCFAASIGCTMGIAFAGNLVTLFIFYEMLTICTYPLIIHGGSKDSIASGSFYIKTLLCSSVFLFLPAIAIVCVTSEAAGLFSARSFISETHPNLLPFIVVMLCYGVAKAAIVPVHIWLPRAMVAPTPVSALLHAVAVVKSGVFTLIKITVCALGIHGMYNYYNAPATIDVAPHHNIMLYLSVVTIIAGSIFAVAQKNLKRLLAYSTVSQLSYITLALSMFTDGAVAAAVFQMVCHAFAKITLFFAVGAVYAASGKTMIRDIDGLGRVMPITFTAFCIGALAMIGIPPAATFWGKFYIITEALKQQNYIVIFTVALSTVLNTLYFVPLMYRVFFAADATCTERVKEAPLLILLAMLVSSTCTILLFLKPNIVLGMLSVR